MAVRIEVQSEEHSGQKAEVRVFEDGKLVAKVVGELKGRPGGSEWELWIKLTEVPVESDEKK